MPHFQQGLDPEDDRIAGHFQQQVLSRQCTVEDKGYQQQGGLRSLELSVDAESHAHTRIV